MHPKTQDPGLPEDQLRSASPLARRLFHELNNALSAVTINAVVLSREIDEDSPTSEIVADILSAARKASALTSQLRRLDAEQRHGPRTPIAFAEDRDRPAS